jgi:transcriptional regulator with XRE-family HTH domain
MDHQEEPTLSEKIAIFIKEKRLARGETQKEFAFICFGDTGKRHWICKIEKGRGITLKTLGIILTAINCDFNLVEH